MCRPRHIPPSHLARRPAIWNRAASGPPAPGRPVAVDVSFSADRKAPFCCPHSWKAGSVLPAHWRRLDAGSGSGSDSVPACDLPAVDRPHSSERPVSVFGCFVDISLCFCGFATTSLGVGAFLFTLLGVHWEFGGIIFGGVPAVSSNARMSPLSCPSSPFRDVTGGVRPPPLPPLPPPVPRLRPHLSPPPCPLSGLSLPNRGLSFRLRTLLRSNRMSRENKNLINRRC